MIGGIKELIDTDDKTSTDEPIFSHIIEKAEGDNRSFAAIVFEARVNGTPVTALCGYTWVPSRDPKQFPLCPRCDELYDFAKDLRS